MSQKSFLISLLLCFMAIFSFAQEKDSSKKKKIPKRKIAKFKYPSGYILNNQGDTIPGFIRMDDSFKDQKRIKFYDEYGARTTYRAGLIKGYGYLDKHFISRPTPFFFSDFFSDTVIFMNRLVDGPAQLFRFYTRRGIFTLKKGPSYFDFLEKPDGEVFEVSYVYKWKRLAEAFTDHPNLGKDITAGKYKPEDTESLIKYYNSWYRNKPKAEPNKQKMSIKSSKEK
ncbi:MAG: hypothetical protein AAFY71_20240 [Bacteroidota bacterium]